MSYKTVKNGITGLLKGLGLQESSYTTSFEDAPANSYESTFIITALSGRLEEVSAETLVDRFYDDQEWTVQVAFQKGGNNQVFNLDRINTKRDEILNELDNSNNWRSFVRILKYKSWDIEDKESYFLLNIKLRVIDTVIYT